MRAAPDGPGGPRRELIQLVTRLVVAQTIAAAAVGLPMSRRHLPSILITLALVVALAGLALLVRSGTRAAWLIALGFELAFVGYGLSRRPAGQQAEPGLGGTAGETLGGQIAQ